MLKEAEIQLIVDARTVPRSRMSPQYNSDVLPKTLSEFQIGYTHISALGGLRGHARDVALSVNTYWENQSFHNYADYAMTNAFRAGLAERRKIGHARRCAVMCAEAMWWRCHRRIIADHLITAGETVFHILRTGHIDPAHLTPGAKPGPAATRTYPGDA